MDKCTFCGNKSLSEKTAQYIYKHKSEFLIVNDVPCIVCDYCGEQYFEGKVIEKIEALFNDYQSKKRIPKKLITAPVEDFSELGL